MFQSRALNNKITNECCLRITYNDKTSAFNQIQEKDISVSIHYRNIQPLATVEKYKVANGCLL